MKEIILIKDGELALKGLNRSTFEDMLTKNIRRRIARLGSFTFRKAQSTLTITPREEGTDLDAVCDELSRVFGIAGFSRAAVAEKTMESILSVAPEYLADQLSEASTFKVEAKRSDKRFPLTSPEISREVGACLLTRFGHLKVDVHHPEITVTVEVRDQGAYIRGNQQKGAGGMPVGSAGKGMLLISGGIDSPVAGYMMAKRGIALTAVHFASPPYTSLRSEQKVHELVSLVSRYSGRVHLYTVPFTEIQEEIREKCPEEYFTLLMRRFMMRIAENLARLHDCHAMITGESVGQVASQTMLALGCTDAVCTLPVFRPCIGMDKEEIITVSRRIGTFEVSIQPFEDCCTVFTPRHPKTRPVLSDVEAIEASLEIDALCRKAVEGVGHLVIGPEGVLHDGN